MHDARVGTDVVDRVGLLGLIDIPLLENIVKGEGLLRNSDGHLGRFGVGYCAKGGR